MALRRNTDDKKTDKRYQKPHLIAKMFDGHPPAIVDFLNSILKRSSLEFAEFLQHYINIFIFERRFFVLP